MQQIPVARPTLGEEEAAAARRAGQGRFRLQIFFPKSQLTLRLSSYTF